MTTSGITIGAAARRTGLPPKTIRYYESIGLVGAVPRDHNGHRAYHEADVLTLYFVGRARALGFSLGEVAELVALWRDRSRSNADVKALAHKRIDEVERRVRTLRTLRRALIDLAGRCRGDDRPDCPIIDDLAGGGSADRAASSTPTTGEQEHD